MSAVRSAPKLARAAFVLGLLAAQPLAAQPLAAQPLDSSASSAPTPASRQQIARELFERGREKWQQREYAEAEALLTASNAQAERPGTLLLLGESQQKLGRLRSALEKFERAARVAQAQQDPAAEARARTRAAAIAPMVPTMEIRFSVPPPQSTLVTLNGVELPREWLGRVMPADAGEYRLEVRAPGHAPYSAHFALINEAARLGVQVVPVTLTALQPPPRPEPLVVAAPAALEDRGSMVQQKQLAWIAGGVGAAAAVTGLVLTLVALEKKNDAAAECEEDALDRDPCSARGVELHQQASKLANLATVSAVASGAALATSFTLFVLAEESTTPTGAGLTYSGSF